MPPSRLNDGQQHTIFDLLSSFGLPLFAQRPTHTDFFRLVDNIEGKGQGYKAIRQILPGTKILEERPLFFVADVERGKWSNRTRDSLIATVQGLGEADRGAFMNLSNLWGTAKDQILALFIVNNFQMTENDLRGRSQQGIFTIAARFNHSCLPNAYASWNPVTLRGGRLTVFATKTIRVDDEIVINYQPNNTYKTRLARRKGLSECYKFNCMCDACKEGQRRSQDSEYRRENMRKDVQRIRKLEDDISREGRHERISKMERVIGQLEEDENEYPLKTNLCTEVIQAYRNEQAEEVTLFDRNDCLTKARSTALKRLYAELLSVGVDSREIKDTLGLIEATT
ncbi:MAG: hypothetical protein Q9213_000732 [Squamulea squamosa]